MAGGSKRKIFAEVACVRHGSANKDDHKSVKVGSMGSHIKRNWGCPACKQSEREAARVSNSEGDQCQ